MEVESQVEKYLVAFCELLPVHVDDWRSILQDSVKPVQNLNNLWEQRHYIKSIDLRYLENFQEVREVVLYQISNRIEEELAKLKELIDKLGKCNNDLRNKLLIFERSTLSLDWERNSEVIRGSGFRPSLPTLLQDGLEFLNFFLKVAKNIGNCFRGLNLEDEATIKEFQASLNVNLGNRIVTQLIALTQYVDNVKAIL